MSKAYDDIDEDLRGQDFIDEVNRRNAAKANGNTQTQQPPGYIPPSQQKARDQRQKARAAQEPGIINGIRRGVTKVKATYNRVDARLDAAGKKYLNSTIHKKVVKKAVGAVGKASRATQKAGQRYLKAETKEVPKIRKDNRTNDARMRKSLSVIDMGRSWVNASSAPSNGWATGSLGGWSTLPPSTGLGGGIFSGVPSSMPRRAPVKKKKTTIVKKTTKRKTTRGRR